MKKIFLLSIAIIFMFTACFDKSEKNEEKVQNEYTILLEKVVNDAKVYENNLKKAADETFIGEGIYINVLKSDNFTPYEGWYYYSVDELDKLNNEKIAEMLNLLAICGPKGRVYCVFGDKAVGIFDYKGVEDTKLNGKSLDINAEDIINKMDNNGKTELKLIETGNSAKAYVIDYPEITSGGVIIKYARTIPIDCEIEFVKETEVIKSTFINTIETGTAKVDVNLNDGIYKIRSKEIYFGKYGEVNTEPGKLLLINNPRSQYLIGEDFDLKGIELKLITQNESYEIDESEIKIENYNKHFSGNQEVKLKARGLEYIFDVKVGNFKTNMSKFDKYKYGEWLYYINYENDENILYRVNESENIKEKVTDFKISEIVDIFEDNIYVFDENNELFTIEKTNFINYKKINKNEFINGEIGVFIKNVYKDSIYYYTYKKNGNNTLSSVYYKCDLEGKNSTFLMQNATFISRIGEKLYWKKEFDGRIFISDLEGNLKGDYIENFDFEREVCYIDKEEIFYFNDLRELKKINLLKKESVVIISNFNYDSFMIFGNNYIGATYKVYGDYVIEKGEIGKEEKEIIDEGKYTIGVGFKSVNGENIFYENRIATKEHHIYSLNIILKEKTLFQIRYGW